MKMTKMEMIFLFIYTLSQAMTCFQIITPSKWGANPANCSAPMKHALPEYVIIIHTVGNACQTQVQCSGETKSIQEYHQRVKGWCDISYNFLISEDGFVYKGCGWRNQGFHTRGYNDLALGIAFLGTFTERSPNESAWKALKCLLSFSVEIGYLSPDYVVMAHSDIISAVSPGEPVRAVISKWPNYRHH